MSFSSIPAALSASITADIEEVAAACASERFALITLTPTEMVAASGVIVTDPLPLTVTVDVMADPPAAGVASCAAARSPIPITLAPISAANIATMRPRRIRICPSKLSIVVPFTEGKTNYPTLSPARRSTLPDRGHSAVVIDRTADRRRKFHEIAQGWQRG